MNMELATIPKKNNHPHNLKLEKKHGKKSEGLKKV